jgi:hypothetical protein
MLDFTPVREKTLTMSELVKDLTRDDLRRLTNAMVDRQLGLIAESTDVDVTFVPSDPNARDDAAATAEEVNLAWTLGHVIVHATASSEEAAFLAQMLACGVSLPDKIRLRSETDWELVTTIAQCRARLEESRRMRLATLDVWPDKHYLRNTYFLGESAPAVGAVERFVRGLSHDDSHLGQIADIARQARAARAQLVIG